MKLLVLSLMLISASAIAQSTSPLFTDSRGTLIKKDRYADVSGSPYLFEEWSNGSVKTKSGKVYNDLQLKYNILTQMLMFKNEEGESFSFVDPLQEFQITQKQGDAPKVFVSGLPKTDEITDNSFLQKIAGGKISLFKRYHVDLNQSSGGYGAQKGEKSFITSFTYYILRDNVLKKISLSKKTLTSILPGIETEIYNFIREKKIDLKKDNDLKKLFDFANNL